MHFSSAVFVVNAVSLALLQREADLWRYARWQLVARSMARPRSGSTYAWYRKIWMVIYLPKLIRSVGSSLIFTLSREIPQVAR